MEPMILYKSLDDAKKLLGTVMYATGSSYTQGMILRAVQYLDRESCQIAATLLSTQEESVSA